MRRFLRRPPGPQRRVVVHGLVGGLGLKRVFGCDPDFERIGFKRVG